MNHTPKNKELVYYRGEVDAWIKSIRKEFSEFSGIAEIVYEHSDDIQHTYELLYELKDEVERLKREINSIMVIQILALKNQNRIEEVVKNK